MTTRTTLNKRMRLIESGGSQSTTTNGSVPSVSPLARLTATIPPFQSPSAIPKTAPLLPTSAAAAAAHDDFMDTNCFEASHPNTIVHIDIDCFYAQVEELRDPSLRLVPLGIQQKNCLVTCNYPARAKGIRKLMSIQEAQQLCPELVLVRGEDLTPYRQMSSRVFEHITRHYPQLSVERLGMDENFVDVTKLVEQRLRSSSIASDDGIPAPVVGCVYPPLSSSETPFLTNCLCGCQRRLIVGTEIAAEIRSMLHRELGITTCAGVGHNKMLAKLAGALNKPNNQTVVVPTRCRDLMIELKELRKIPGIGQKTESLLSEIQVTDIASLQAADQTALVLKFGPEMAKKLKDWSNGVDLSAVRTSSVRPKTIGLEDACPRQPISVRQEIEDKFRTLLQRLLTQVTDDGRVPVAIKMTLRKYDAVRKTSHRETKQANILPTLFHMRPMAANGGVVAPPKLSIIPGGEEKVLQIVMRLFERVIDLRLPFNVTLLGLAFSKFQERRGVGLGGGGCTPSGMGSIASYLLKGGGGVGVGKKDLEVQSVTSLRSEGEESASDLPSPVAHFNGVGRFYREQRDLETMSDTMSVASDLSEDQQSEFGVEPSPKKSRLALSFMAKRRCFGVQQQQNGGVEPMDCASPSKLRVADLRLNSIDREIVSGAGGGAVGGGAVGGGMSRGELPSVVPKTVDAAVFRELPADMQNELIRSWAAVAVVNESVGVGTRQKTAALVGDNMKGILMVKNGKATTATETKAVGGKGASTTTTLHRYFIANN